MATAMALVTATAAEGDAQGRLWSPWSGLPDDISSLHHDMLSHLPDDIGPTQHPLEAAPSLPDDVLPPHEGMSARRLSDDYPSGHGYGHGHDYPYTRGGGESRFRHSVVVLSTLGSPSREHGQGVAEFAWEPPRKSKIVMNNLHDWSF